MELIIGWSLVRSQPGPPNFEFISSLLGELTVVGSKRSGATGIIGGVSGEKDWRLQGQEEYLQGATLLRTRYKAWSEDWEHDHCEFCWAKFMDPRFSAQHAQFIGEHPEVLTEGYAVQGRRPDASSGGQMGRIYADDQKTIHPKRDVEERTVYWWICPTCVKDFAQRFEWMVLEGPAKP